MSDGPNWPRFPGEPNMPRSADMVTFTGMSHFPYKWEWVFCNRCGGKFYHPDAYKIRLYYCGTCQKQLRGELEGL